MQALFPLLITFGLMWVLLIRPQQRRVRQHQSIVASLVEGDEVVTTGGLIGTIEEINDDVLTVEVAPGVSVRMLRSAVQTRIGPDEAGAAEIPEGIDQEEIDFAELDIEEIDLDDIDLDQIGPGETGPGDVGTGEDTELPEIPQAPLGEPSPSVGEAPRPEDKS